MNADLWTGQALGSNVWVIGGEHMSGGHIDYNRGAHGVALLTDVSIALFTPKTARFGAFTLVRSPFSSPGSATTIPACSQQDGFTSSRVGFEKVGRISTEKWCTTTPEGPVYLQTRLKYFNDF